jgi:hypothetical protein
MENMVTSSTKWGCSGHRIHQLDIWVSLDMLNYRGKYSCTYEVNYRVHSYRVYMGKEECQWEFQDPKLEVLYHIRPYFVGIFPYIALT